LGHESVSSERGCNSPGREADH